MPTASLDGENAGPSQITLATRLGRALVRRFKRIWAPIDARLMRLAAKSGRFSSFYFAFFSREFDREHRAVMAGRLLWQASRSGPATTTSLLRRNTHRIEKGLLMRPRRGTFALDYIEETVDFYTSFVATEEGRAENNGEVRWSTDVLDEYFRVSAPHPLVDRLRTKYVQCDRPVNCGDGQPRSPYRRDLSVPPPVKYDDLLALAIRRRSVRWFLDKPVPRELIEKAVAVASLSPSACNRQPYTFRVFDDPAVVQTVAELPGGTAGFAHQFPAVIALVGELRNYYGERDRHLIYIDASLAAMSFVYAAETLGLGTCCINWPDIEEDELRAEKTLGLEPDQRVIMFIAVGYPDPDGMVAYSQKKENERLIQYNF